MRFDLVVFLALCFVPLPIQAQRKSLAPTQVTLLPGQSVRTQITGPVFNRVTCDDAGNIYVRQVRDSEETDLERQPLLKITPNGALAGTFKISSASPDLTFHDFFVKSNGDVYLMGWSVEPANSGNRVYIVKFANNGSLKSVAHITSVEPFMPSAIAVFKSGEILLTGTQGDELHTPFTAVFSARGNLIKKILDPEDDDLRRRAELGDEAVLSTSSNAGNSAVEFGTAVAGSDGNIYVLRSTSPALIFVISPRGELIRTLHIDPGDPDLVGLDLHTAVGKLALLFGRHDGMGSLLRIVNLEGHDIATHVIHEQAIPHGSLACYAPPAFTFAVVNDPSGPLYLQHLEPK
jgi:hypothetical protein